MTDAAVPDDEDDGPVVEFRQPTDEQAAEVHIAKCEHCGYYHARYSTGHNWVQTCIAHRDMWNEEGVHTHDEPCFKWAVKGISICTSHGGATKRNRQIAEENLQKRKLEGELRLVGNTIDPIVRAKNPVEALLDDVAQSAQICYWLGEQVAKLHVDDPSEHDMADFLGFSETGRTLSVPNRNKLIGVDHNNNLATHPYWQEFNRERERHARLCKMAIEAGIGEKMVNIAQMQAMMIARLINDVLGDVGLSPTQLVAARQKMAALMSAKQRGLPA